MYRKATTDDCEKIHALICDMENKTLPFGKFSEIFGAQLRGGDYYCLVNERDHDVIAVLNLRFEQQLHHCERIAEIMEFAVDPAWRNQGIGREMLETACRIARAHDCTQIEVACNRLRTDTHRFYLREEMRKFHYKFSKPLTGENSAENALGR